MDTSKTETYGTSIGTNEMGQHFNGTVTGTLLHYYHINFVVDSNV